MALSVPTLFETASAAKNSCCDGLSVSSTDPHIQHRKLKEAENQREN